MVYHPSIGEDVSIERPLDSESFRARVKSVSGKPGGHPWEVQIEFERLDGIHELRPTCGLDDISWSFDPNKESEFREFQSRLQTFRDQIERQEQQTVFDSY
jgi:hypothetical protein